MSGIYRITFQTETAGTVRSKRRSMLHLVHIITFFFPQELCHIFFLVAMYETQYRHYYFHFMNEETEAWKMLMTLRPTHWHVPFTWYIWFIATYFIHINRPKPSTALLQALCAQKLPNEQTPRQGLSQPPVWVRAKRSRRGKMENQM